MESGACTIFYIGYVYDKNITFISFLISIVVVKSFILEEWETEDYSSPFDVFPSIQVSFSTQFAPHSDKKWR